MARNEETQKIEANLLALHLEPERVERVVAGLDRLLDIEKSLGIHGSKRSNREVFTSLGFDDEEVLNVITALVVINVLTADESSHEDYAMLSKAIMYGYWVAGNRRA